MSPIILRRKIKCEDEKTKNPNETHLYQWLCLCLYTFAAPLPAGWLRHARRAGARGRRRRRPLRMQERRGVSLHGELKGATALLWMRFVQNLSINLVYFYSSHLLCERASEEPQRERVKPSPKTRSHAGGGWADYFARLFFSREHQQLAHRFFL